MDEAVLKQTVRTLADALDKIAAFAPGNGDVCEIIARTARAALSDPIVKQIVEEK